VSHQENLFEMFRRADNADAIRGTGLGLVIVKETVESCQGTLSFTSVEGEGTTFTVVLPELKQAENT
jgi:signal transduction histidine kinase